MTPSTARAWLGGAGRLRAAALAAVLCGCAAGCSSGGGARTAIATTGPATTAAAATSAPATATGATAASGPTTSAADPSTVGARTTVAPAADGGCRIIDDASVTRIAGIEIVESTHVTVAATTDACLFVGVGTLGAAAPAPLAALARPLGIAALGGIATGGHEFVLVTLAPKATSTVPWAGQPPAGQVRLTGAGAAAMGASSPTGGGAGAVLSDAGESVAVVVVGTNAPTPLDTITRLLARADVSI